MFPQSVPLTSIQQQVLALLFSGSSVHDAAEKAGIHRNTIANWRRSSEPFRAAILNLQREQAAFWSNELQELAAVAIETLHKSMIDSNAPWGVRLKAALAVIERVTAPTLPDSDPDPTYPNVVAMPIVQPALEPAALHNDAQPPAPKPGLQLVPAAVRRSSTTPARNAPCPCGSTSKYKRCCLRKTMAA